MNWTLTVAASGKMLTGLTSPKFLFGEAVQSWGHDDKEFIRRTNFLKPCVTLYSPEASIIALACDDTSAADHQIDLAGDGGFSVRCDRCYIFLSIYGGNHIWRKIAAECEKTIIYSKLAMQFAVMVPVMSGDKSGCYVSQKDFFEGVPVWGSVFPDSSLVRV